VQSQIQAWGLRLIDLASNESRTIIDRTLTNLIADYDFSPDGRYIVVSNGTPIMTTHDFNGAVVWDVKSGSLIATTSGNAFRKDVMFSADSSSIISVENNSRVTIWNFNENVTHFNHIVADTSPDNLHDYSLAENLPYLLGSMIDDWHPRDRTLYIWEIQTGSEIFSVDIAPDYWHDRLAVNAPAVFLAAGSAVDETKIIDIWEIETGEHFQLSVSQ
jgi:uncharacterized protein with WD repeat